MRLLSRILFALSVLAGATQAQTWVKVANEGDTVSYTMVSVGGDGFTVPTFRYGAAKGTPYGCGTGPALAADAWVTQPAMTVLSTFEVTNAVLTPTDPAPCYVKELDVLETAVAQTVVVNGKPVTVPALPVVTPPSVSQKTCTVPAQTISVTINPDGSFTANLSGLVISCK